MVKNTTPAFINYTRHVLKWEGKTSSDPRDKAARCFPGGVHTNKGVTFCNFKAYGKELGIQPITHARFLQLTDDEVRRFIFKFTQMARADKVPTNVGLAMTEAAYMSGPTRALEHLRAAVRNLGFPGRTNAEAIDSANKIGNRRLFPEYQKVREDYLRRLGRLPDYAWAFNGWMNRLREFNEKHTPKVVFPFFF